MKLTVAVTVLSVSNAAWTSPCNDDSYKALPFCDQSLAFRDRATDLVSRISKDDKLGVNQDSSPLSNSASALPSVSIPKYEWWSEALHGVANSPGVHFDDDIPSATSFPQVISTSMSYNTTLYAAIGHAIGLEARATFKNDHSGLTFWTPNVNNARDPRWGRLQETPGEDPFLTQTYVENYVPALEHDDEVDPEGSFLQISACCKHYAAYSLENYAGIDRFHFDSNVTDQDFTDTYFPPFVACAGKDHAAASSMMCSYNSVNGVPSCASKWLMTEKAREEWGFEGYITSDCGATEDVFTTHGFTNSTSETVKVTLEAGMDTDCGGFMAKNLEDSVNDGTVDMSLVDGALVNLITVQMRLGMFENDDSPHPYAGIDKDVIDTPEHRELALEAARQSITLLKNEDGALPFNRDTTEKILVVGPHGQATDAMQGNYYGTAPFLTSPLQGLKDIFIYGGVVDNVDGCSIGGTENPDDDQKMIVEAANAVVNGNDGAYDEIVLFVGIDQTVESEGNDRVSIGMTGAQTDLIEAVLEAGEKVGKRVHMVVMAGGAVCLGEYKDDARVGSIMYVGYPGQSGGTAIAETLWGNVNPSGKLTQTFYSGAFVDESDFLSMHFRPSEEVGEPGRTYRFYTGENVVYPFGWGLSYADFEYEEVAWDEGKKLLEIGVSNGGDVDGAESILVFLAPPKDSGVGGLPIKSLRGFQKYVIAAGEKKEVFVQFNDEDFMLSDEGGEMVKVSGKWQVSFGEGRDLVVEIDV